MCQKGIILTGLGGQGIVMSGVILAKAAALDGKNVVQTQNYGPESRGGSCRADVIISDGEIGYPRVEDANVICALTKDGFNKYKDELCDKATIILDKDVDICGCKSTKKFNVVEYANDVLKRPQALNMILLGVITKVTGLVSYDSVVKAITASLPKASLEVNIKAFDDGYNMSEAA